MKYGIQLYTLREFTEKDMVGVLEQVSEMGYEGIELAGFGNSTPEEVAETAARLNLKVVSAHVGADDLYDNLEDWIEKAKLLKLDNLTVPYIAPEDLDGDALTATAEKLNSIIARLKFEGIHLVYHNHDFEFVNDRLDNLAALCPELRLELDLYWAAFAKVHPLKALKKYGRRIVQLHLKDMMKAPEGQEDFVVEHATPNPVLLTGTINYKRVLRQASYNNIPWGIVEMDKTEGDALSDVRQSLENLKNLK